jgi:putative PIN family toxin of toxin-antitoxin system
MNREPIVIDTNVFISFALTSTTTPALAVEYAINNFIILQSPATIGELVTKLLLPKFERYVTLEQRQQLLVRILEISLLIRPTDHTEICRDRDDNKFLNLATSGEARYLITGDNDLLILQRYGKTEIVTPREFLKIVRR